MKIEEHVPVRPPVPASGVRLAFPKPPFPGVRPASIHLLTTGLLLLNLARLGFCGLQQENLNCISAQMLLPNLPKFRQVKKKKKGNKN